MIPYDEWKEIESVVRMSSGISSMRLLMDTLKEGHDKVTWGVAFKIPSDDVEATRAYLDHREKVLPDDNYLIY